jgi:hypothetical protein
MRIRNLEKVDVDSLHAHMQQLDPVEVRTIFKARYTVY